MGHGSAHFVSAENGSGTGWGFMHRMIGATGQSPREDRRLLALNLDRRREHPS